MERKRAVAELTSQMMHKHYCENDVEAVIGLFDEQLTWFGTGEYECASGPEAVAEIFRKFKGMVPKCNLSDEQYEVMAVSPEIYVCSGRIWLTTDPSVKMYLRVHQRITTVFRWGQQGFRCCHIHISNPYMEMTKADVGFPTQIGQQSYEYLRECIAAQKKQIEEQTEMLQREGPG